MAGQPNLKGAWQERFAALRNVPAVLKLVWESGRLVVTLGIVFRVVLALLPIALLWVTKLIIDLIVRSVTTHQPITNHLWWLVAAEFFLAVFSSLLRRTIAYLDGLLAA